METNNYPNWLVPIEQSKKLKRIGFDVECAFFYDDILKEISFDEEDVGQSNLRQLDWQGDFDDYNEAREELLNNLIEKYVKRKK